MVVELKKMFTLDIWFRYFIAKRLYNQTRSVVQFIQAKGNPLCNTLV